MLPPVAVLVWFNRDWVSMLVKVLKDMGISNMGLHSTVQILPNLIMCINESAYYGNISIPLVLCIVR